MGCGESPLYKLVDARVCNPRPCFVRCLCSRGCGRYAIDAGLGVGVCASGVVSTRTPVDSSVLAARVLHSICSSTHQRVEPDGGEMVAVGHSGVPAALGRSLSVDCWRLGKQVDLRCDGAAKTTRLRDLAAV